MTKKKYEVLAIIGARGGSKSVPKKNIQPLAGKPLIAWTIEEAKKTKLVSRIIVSTDSEEIAEVARQYGAEAPFLRPAELAGDLALVDDFLRHALDWLKENENYKPDIVALLPPTSPLRTAAHIDKGIQQLTEMPEADVVRPITESPKHPYKMWKISEDGKWLEAFLPKSFTGMGDTYYTSRQALPKVFVHTGAMNVMWSKTLRDPNPEKKIGFFITSAEESVNIDGPIDFLIAEIIMKKRLGLD